MARVHRVALVGDAQTPLGIEIGAVYEFTCRGQRAVLNDPADKDFVGLASDVTGLERAGVRSNIAAVPDGDGQRHGAFFYEGLAFSIAGIVWPDEQAAVGRQGKLLRATDAMRGDGLLRWKPSLTDWVQVAFRQQQPTRITQRRPKQFAVVGVCEDPTVVSSIETTVVQAGAGTVTASNLGIVDAWPVVTITGPCANPRVFNDSNGDRLRFNGALDSASSIAIECNPRRRAMTRQDGSLADGLFDYLNSTGDWMAIAPGTNAIRLDGDLLGAGASVTVSFRHTWG